VYKNLLIIFLVLLDLLIKQIIFYLIDLNNFIYVTSFFDLAHIHNFGISFGLFSGLFPSWFFILIGSMIIIFLFSLFLKSKNILEKLGYAFILAGALGNILDRAINGFVIDFIYIHYKDFYWPAFNFADIYISIGVLIILLQIINDLRKRDFK
jgi:signal peptidase II